MKRERRNTECKSKRPLPQHKYKGKATRIAATCFVCNIWWNQTTIKRSHCSLLFMPFSFTSDAFCQTGQCVLAVCVHFHPSLLFSFDDDTSTIIIADSKQVKWQYFFFHRKTEEKNTIWSKSRTQIKIIHPCFHGGMNGREKRRFCSSCLLCYSFSQANLHVLTHFAFTLNAILKPLNLLRLKCKLFNNNSKK